MDTDLGQLVGDFQNFFLGLYRQAQPAAGAQSQPAAGAQSQPAAGAQNPAATGGRAKAFLAFEAVGVPMSAEMFALKTGEFDIGLATQQFSLCANAAPALDGQTLRGGGLLTLDGLYDLLLTEAAPVAASDLDSFGRLKRAAQEAFTNAESSYSIPGVQGVFHAASPSPADFPAPSAEACWTRHSFEHDATSQVAAAPAVPGQGPRQLPGPPRPMPNWGWRMATPEVAGMLHKTPLQMMTAMPRVPAAPVIQVQPRIVPLPPHLPAPPHIPAPPSRPGVPPPPVLHPVLRLAAMPAFANVLARSVVLPVRTSMPPPALPMVHPVLRVDLVRAQMQQMAASATALATTTKRFTLSFDYCLVSAARPWLSGGLLVAGNWFVPHMAAGQIASGTGAGNGVFEALPMAALMVRNLVIEGDWSEADCAAMHTSLNFGPFSLMGRSIETVTNTVSSPGMQLVAWVLEPLPCLPPVADPGLSSGSPPSAGPAAAEPTPAPLTPAAPITNAPASTLAASTQAVPTTAQAAAAT